MGPDDQPPRAAEILEYFVRNPRAADSLEGVARWRLLEEAVRRNVEEVAESLHWLTLHGYLVRQTPAGSEPIFSLNEARRAEAERLLGSAPAKRRG